MGETGQWQLLDWSVHGAHTIALDPHEKSVVPDSSLSKKISSVRSESTIHSSLCGVLVDIKVPGQFPPLAACTAVLVAAADG